MAVFVNCDKKLVSYGRCLADFYEIIEPFIIGVRLGVLGQSSNVTKGLNVKIQKHLF